MTRALTTREELRAATAAAPRPLGLVPTMGSLHEGHRSLIRRSRGADLTTVVTIFVNPRQFGDAHDYGGYPRDLAADLVVCEDEAVDIVWMPPAGEVYPPGFDTSVRVGAIAEPLEGAARPGHFEGVATVVAVLFALVGADRAYFGEKDAQQLRVVSRMAADLGFPTVVVPCPTVREPDGLALSSRNGRLGPGERRAAPVLRRSLLEARALWESGERDAEALRSRMREVLAGEPLAEVEYVSCADDATLAELDRVSQRALLSAAVRFGSTRLIDNEPLVEEGARDVPGSAGP